MADKRQENKQNVKLTGASNLSVPCTKVINLHFEALRGSENWIPWSLRMKYLLKQEGIDSYLEDANYKLQNDDENRGRFMLLLYTHMEDKVLQDLMIKLGENVNNPYYAWKGLLNTFYDKREQKGYEALIG